MERVNLTLAIEQARAVGAELDLANRIRLGQFGEIASIAAQGGILVQDEHAQGGGRQARPDEIARITALCRDLAAAFGHGRGSSFGIGARGANLTTRRGYEVMKAVRKAIADHDQPGGNTVDHDGLTVRYTSDEAPVASMA
ncbi:MAG: hypothetical protein K2X97_07365 [Mycobacteriaceae bacterium]|nr:hypothetical protein [Mycobacteriaceae bacterium]